jgi:uncharacterized membrane-anchored protein YitT (DUF2179 family)
VKRFWQESLNTFLIALGVLLAGMGIKGFLLSSHFIDGGVTGISMLISAVTGTSLAIWIVVVNLPFIALADRRCVRDP